MAGATSCPQAGQEVGDAGLRQLEALTRLKVLQIDNTQFTDAGTLAIQIAD